MSETIEKFEGFKIPPLCDPERPAIPCESLNEAICIECNRCLCMSTPSYVHCEECLFTPFNPAAVPAYRRWNAQFYPEGAWTDENSN